MGLGTMDTFRTDGGRRGDGRRAIGGAGAVLALAAGLLGLPAASVAQPPRFEHYLIGGDTIGDLKASITAAAPLGGKALGLTNVVISPEFRFAEINGACRAVGVTVALDVKVTLPKVKVMPAGFEARWREIHDGVREHEMMHVRIAEVYAGRIETAIRAAHSRAGCATLERTLAADIGALQERHRKMQRTYDIIDAGRVMSLLP